MPRRNRKSPVEGFLDLAARLPWWLCLALAAIGYLSLHALAVSPPPEIRSSTDIGNAFVPIMLRGAAQVGQYVVPVLFTAAAILSVIRTFRLRGSSSVVSNNDRAESQSDFSATPTCPKCNAPMVQRRASRGNNVGEAFWGCTQYPVCKGTRPLA